MTEDLRSEVRRLLAEVDRSDLTAEELGEIARILGDAADRKQKP